MRNANGYPRNIQPETVEVGDLIIVELKQAKGVVMTKRGRIDRIIPHMMMRQAITAEGGILFTWEPGVSRNDYTLVILERQAKPQEPLAMFDLERLAV
jgi:hypothetical protein